MSDEIEAVPGGENPTGRDAKGRFRSGNQVSRGHGRPRAKWRKVFDEVVTPKRFRGVLEALLSAAEGGDMQAARIVVERTLGRLEDAGIVGEPESVRIVFEGDDDTGQPAVIVKREPRRREPEPEPEREPRPESDYTGKPPGIGKMIWQSMSAEKRRRFIEQGHQAPPEPAVEEPDEEPEEARPRLTARDIRERRSGRK